MAKPDTGNSATFHRPASMPGVELVSVCYRERSFPEHSHGDYVVGAVVGGAETLRVEGRSYVVGTGGVLHLHPDQPHTNATVGPDALRYHVLYLRDEIVRRFGSHEDAAPRFRTAARADAALFAATLAAHAALRDEMVGRLEQESALGALVRAMTLDTAGPATPTTRQPRQSDRIAEAKAYIDAHYANDFGLQALADLSGLSPFHFIRCFKDAIGLSPLAYRNQCRIVAARARLLDGEPIAQVALAMGYADQSHLTRQFQRLVGVSPRRYVQQ